MTGSLATLAEVLAPVVALLAAAGVVCALVVLARPHAVIAYAQQHTAFVIGASLIGALSLVLASGLMLMLRRT